MFSLSKKKRTASTASDKSINNTPERPTTPDARDPSPDPPSPSPSRHAKAATMGVTTSSSGTNLLVPDAPTARGRPRSSSDVSSSSANGRGGRPLSLNLNGVSNTGLATTVSNTGEGNLTFDHVPTRGRPTTLVQAPELIVDLASPSVGNGESFAENDESSLLTPVPGSTSEREAEKRAGFVGIDGVGTTPTNGGGVTAAPTNGLTTTAPTQVNGRPRAATTTDQPTIPFSTASAPSSPPLSGSGSGGLPASSSNNSIAGSSTMSQTFSTTSSTTSARPGSRSSSVTSQDNPSSSGGTFLAPRPPVAARSPSQTRSMSGSSKKGRSSSGGMGGIAGALALSGVALASPSGQLRQPLGMAALQRVNSNPGSVVSNGGGGGGGGGRESFEDNHSDAGSNIGHDAFVSMDALGDFDDALSQLGTGYAVASSKRNAEFHQIFKNIPEDDYLIEDYGCALQREILIQGRLYISEHHLSFNANIFGWVTTHTLPFAEIVSIEKRMTAYVIPNAIQVTTLHARYTFASFLSRDTTHDLICNIWRMVHPVVPPSAGIPDTLGAESDEEDVHSLESHEDDGASASGGKKKKRLRALSGRRRAGTDSSAGKGGGGGDSAPAGANGDKLRPGIGSPRTTSSRPSGGAGGGGGGGGSGPAAIHPQTVDTLPTLKNLKEVCMDTTFPSAPEKIYNLMFTSGFMKDFWANNQQLRDIQISDWAPEKSGSNLLTRSMSYIKPLNGSIGPKQTKCLITDESAHVDFDDYVCVITTTRTPDVPSGSAFAVKTRTSMTWAKNNSCRVVVTTGVEWSKSSFIKGIIERSCIDGQKTYHGDLEKSMRAYIHAHRSEFLEEGQSAPAEGEVEDAEESAALEEQREVDLGRRPSMSAKMAEDMKSDNPFLRAVKPLLDVLGGARDMLTGDNTRSLALGLVVGVLILSNLYTLTSKSPPSPGRPGAGGEGGGAGPKAKQGRARNPDEIAVAVRGALHDYFSSMQLPTNQQTHQFGTEEKRDGVPSKDPQVEANEILKIIEELEGRLEKLKATVKTATAVESDATGVDELD